MKTKNLTPWCNLYCSELKFNIKISPSAIKAILSFLIALDCCYVLLLFTLGFKLWYTIIILLFSFLLINYRNSILLLLQRRSSTFFTKFFVQQADFFVLTGTGECQFSGQKTLQLSASSQINLWGYWLAFTGSSASNKYIFKDSLSTKEQARVSRTIMRMRQFPNEAIEPNN